MSGKVKISEEACWNQQSSAAEKLSVIIFGDVEVLHLNQKSTLNDMGMFCWEICWKISAYVLNDPWLEIVEKDEWIQATTWHKSMHKLERTDRTRGGNTQLKFIYSLPAYARQFMKMYIHVDVYVESGPCFCWI